MVMPSCAVTVAVMMLAADVVIDVAAPPAGDQTMVAVASVVVAVIVTAVMILAIVSL